MYVYIYFNQPLVMSQRAVKTLLVLAPPPLSETALSLCGRSNKAFQFWKGVKSQAVNTGLNVFWLLHCSLVLETLLFSIFPPTAENKDAP